MVKENILPHHLLNILKWLMIVSQLLQCSALPLVASELSPSELAAQNARVAEYFARRLNRARLTGIQQHQYRITTPTPKRDQIREAVYDLSGSNVINNHQPFPIFSYPGVHLIPSYEYNPPAAQATQNVPPYHQRLPLSEGWTNNFRRNPCEYAEYPNWMTRTRF